MTEAEIEKLINDIYFGVVHVEHLPMELYLYYSNYLLGGLYQGYGTTLTDLVKSMNNLNLDLISDYEKGVRAHTLGNLSENIYHFSAAKTFQQVYDLQQGLIVDGFKVSFSEYKKYATAIVNQYNKNWLKVEYNTTIMSAMAASEWQTVYNQRSQFPLLQYQTVRDGRVRPDHARLDNIVRPVNDAFWNSFYPPNGWQCRCIVIQLEKGAAEITQLSAADKKEIKQDVPEVFRNNPGKSGRIFADHHPYFNVPERYAELKKNNFNLPLPRTKIEKPVVKKAVEEVMKPVVQPLPTFEKTIEQRIDDIKINAKALDAEFKPIKDELKAKIDALVDELNITTKEINSMYRAGIKTTEAAEEYKIKYNKLKQGRAQYEKLLKDKAKVDYNYSVKASEILKSKNAPAKVQVVNAKTLAIDTNKHRVQGYEIFKNIVGDKANRVEMNIKLQVKNGRAFFDRRGYMSIKSAEKLETIAHELGHALEHFDQEHFKEVKKFYEQRTRGSALDRLSNKYPNHGYGVREVYKDDKFQNAYTGKWYSDGNGNQTASEITSMWFSHALDDLHGFIEKDPEFFEYIYRLFNL